MDLRKSTCRLNRTSVVHNLLLEIFALLGCYAAPIKRPETSGNNYQSTSHNILEERISHLPRRGSLKSRTFLLVTDMNLANHICFILFGEVLTVASHVIKHTLHWRMKFV